SAALIEQGELAGKLDTAFSDIAAQLKDRLDLRRQILTDCAYPAFLLTLLMFALPMPTLIAKGFDAYLAALLPPLIAVVALIAFCWFAGPALLARPELALPWDRAIYRFPMVG